MIERPAAGFSRAAGHDVNRALMRVESGRFHIRARALGPSTVSVQFHPGAQRPGASVVSVQQVRAFVSVAVATQHEVHTVRFEQRQKVLPHLDQCGFRIGVVAPLGVGRVMPEGDQPILRRVVEVGTQPVGHRPGCGAARSHRVQADEVNVAVVERVVILRARSDSAHFSVLGQREDLVVGNGGWRRGRLVRLVIANGGPERRFPERRGIHIKDRVLVFRIGAGVVGVVAEEQHRIQIVAAIHALERVAHVVLVHVRRAAIAQRPEPHRLARAGQRRRENVIIQPAEQRGVREAEGVEIFCARREVRHFQPVLVGGTWAGDEEIQFIRVGAETHVPDDPGIRAPLHDGVAPTDALQPGTAQDDG